MPRILIVDDDKSIRCILREILEHAGYEVDEARNGQEGLQHYRARPSDLVITDILMPEKNGLETIKELRHDFPYVKIIAMFGSPRFRETIQQLGVQPTLQKPFSLHELLEVVQAVVSNQNYTALV